MLNDPSLIISIVSVLIAMISFGFAVAAYFENRRTVYMSFFNIIEKHHSKEITKLRRIFRTNLEDKAREAKKQGVSLYQIDRGLQLNISTLVNYYEYLGMFLQGAEHIFTKKMRKIILEMLHNSVTQHWNQLVKYKDVIYPDRPSDWAQSFQWLYNEVSDYRKKYTS